MFHEDMHQLIKNHAVILDTSKSFWESTNCGDRINFFDDWLNELSGLICIDVIIKSVVQRVFFVFIRDLHGYCGSRCTRMVQLLFNNLTINWLQRGSVHKLTGQINEIFMISWDCTRDPFYKHGLTLIPAWISNHMPSKVWEEIIYPFPNFNGCTVEVWEWISNFNPH